MRPYRLERFRIVRSRQGFVIYGEQADPHYHSRIPDTPQFASEIAAAQWVRASVDSGGRFSRFTLNGSPPIIPNGHFAGAVGSACYSGCDTRTVYASNYYAPTVTTLDFHNWGTRDLEIPPTPPPPARPRRRTNTIASFPAEAPTGITPGAGIRSIGVEFECELPAHFALELDRLDGTNPRIEIHHDGSLEAYQSGNTTREVCFWSTDVSEIIRFVGVMFDHFEAEPNDTCGFHVHVRPTEGNVWAFATADYWSGFYRAYRAFAQSQESIGGISTDALRTKYQARTSSHWCIMRAHTIDFMAQLHARLSNDRYTAINLASLNRHSFGTVEHRILPYQSSIVETERTLRWFTETVSGLLGRSLLYAETTVAPTDGVSETRIELAGAPDSMILPTVRIHPSESDTLPPVSVSEPDLEGIGYILPRTTRSEDRNHVSYRIR